MSLSMKKCVVGDSMTVRIKRAIVEEAKQLHKMMLAGLKDK